MSETSDKEYDVEYELDYEFHNDFYIKDDSSIYNTTARELKVVRKLSPTRKTLKWLRGKGYLSWWDFKLSAGHLPEGCTLLAFIAFLASVPISVVGGIFALNVLGNPFTPAFLIPGVITLITGILLAFDFSNYLLMENKLSNLYKETRSILVPRAHVNTFEQIEGIKNKRLNDTDKKKLFDAMYEYPHEVNTQINKLMEMKKQLPENLSKHHSEYSVFKDADKMLHELFALRDSAEVSRTIDEVSKILASVDERENLEKLGVSVKELAEASEFLASVKKESDTSHKNKSENNASHSSIVDSLNNSFDSDDNSFDSDDMLFEEVPAVQNHISARR